MSGLDELTRDELISLVLELHTSNEALCEQNATLTARVESLEKEVADLRNRLSGGGDGPSWVKANRPKKEKAARKQRKKAFVRRREEATEVRVHAVDSCPDCGHRLSGGWVHRRRQVIEIPVVRYEVIEHVMVRRRCGVCGKACTPSLDLSSDVVGAHRIGIRLMSLISHLKTVGRLPVRTIQSTLRALYQLHLSIGEIAEILHTVAERGEALREGILAEVRGSPFVHGDETGWRQDGQNGFIWSFSTPNVRYFVYNKSRSGQVAKEVLGEDFTGIVVSDFYSGYSPLLCPHQRCWVHFLRDLHALKDAYPNDTGVHQWVDSVIEVYRRAKAFKGPNARARVSERRALESALYALAEPYLKTDAPQRILSERIARFLPELLVFVEHPEVPSENNAAERAIRPAVIARKISGGTRSQKGSETKMTLMSLFGTWAAQGRNPVEACRQMLIAPAG